MGIGKNRLTCDQAKQMDMVDFLASIGHQPSKVKNNNYWYYSPLREEKTPSFKIDRKLNWWYDHGLGKGGNIIDFGILYYHCSVSEFLDKLDGNSFLQKPVKLLQPDDEPVVKIISEKEISSVFLLRYLKQRKIAEAVAKKYCKEICFSIRDKTYLAIDFCNDRGGVELRNAWFKGGSSPKAVTTIETGSDELIIFEGFFDFLSYQTISKSQSLPPANFLVLNSLSFFEKSRLYMEVHDKIRLFLDGDSSGIKWTEKAMGWSKKYVDESNLYKGYKDLNDWTQHIGKSLKNRLKL
jgi:hypothetical protein